MKPILDKLTRPFKRRRLELPQPPAAPPPFLGGAGSWGRSRQLWAYQGWVFAAVNAIARRVAGVPLRLFRAEGAGPGPELTRHPALDLLARPNPILTGRSLRFVLALHLELTGMAFVLVADNALGRPAELWPLSPADLIEISAGPDTARPITGFVFSDGSGRRQTYAPDEIIYLRHPSPTSLIYGASPIEANAHAFDIDLAVRVYQRNFFRNSARPELVLSTDQRLTETEARRILTRWNQKHQGLSHVFEPTVLDGGLKAQPLSFSAKDFEFMALAGWTQDNILAAYGVPAGKLGLVKDLNRANAFAVDVTFNAECVRPRLELIEDALNARLLPRWGRGLLLRHDNPVPADRAQAHAEAMARLDRGVITVNEYRASLGMEPVAWGDEPIPRPAAQPWPAAGVGDSHAGRRAAGRDPGEVIRAHYPRLLARFAGWSKAKVAQALQDEPGLLAPLLPPAAEAGRRERINRHLTRCLIEGKGLAAALAGPGQSEQGA